MILLRNRLSRRPNRRSGYALILAIVLISALVAIATAFLLSANSSSKTSGLRAGDARARLEADAALAAMVRRLEATDAEIDATPSYDTREEAEPRIDVNKDVYSSGVTTGAAAASAPPAAVSVRVSSEQTRVHVDSATPFALGIAFGTSFTSGKIEKDAAEISVDSGDAFPESGYLWIQGELVRYGKRKGGTFSDLTRGVAGSKSGPFEEAAQYPPGTPVLDARAHAVAKHRIRALNGQFRPYETIAEIARAKSDPAGAPGLDVEELQRIEPWLTQWSDRDGHDDWSMPARITAPIVADGQTRTVQCDQPQYFGVGVTVKIEGPGGVEYGMVVKNKQGTVTLEEPLSLSQAAYSAKISGLVPHPIHINSASQRLLEALFTGLDVARASTPDPITKEVAQEIAKRTLAQPVKGWRDWLERVLLPAYKAKALSIHQLESLLRNAENSNDAELRYSTLPITFLAKGASRIIAASSVTAPSGIERGRAEVEAVVEVHRQNHGAEDVGIHAVTRQTEYEETFRLSRRARGWMTFPFNTGFYDGSDPPSRFFTSLHSYDPISEILSIYPSEDPAISFVQPSPSRDAYPDTRAEHFDVSLTPEGRDVTKLKPWIKNVNDAPAMLGGGTEQYMYPGSISGWFRTQNWDGVLMDCGADADYRDRISLSIEKGELIARIKDPAGDDPDPLQIVPNEVHLPIGGQLDANTWYHFTLEWRGSSPSDFTLKVDGLPRGTHRLLTHLTDALPSYAPGDDAKPIPVESTEGFPLWGVLRIGNELIEYSSKVKGAFITTWQTKGLSAWTGGRSRREFPIQETLVKQNAHPKGATVELYGYSSRLTSWVVPGGGTLSTALGKFSAAKISANFNAPDQIEIAAVPGGGGPPGGGNIPLGRGFEGVGLGNGSITELELESLDATVDPNFIEAFPATGGYAVMFQFQTTAAVKSAKGSDLFGAELIRFGSRAGTKLTGVQRGQAMAPYFTDGSLDGKGNKHAFVTKWLNPQLATNPRFYVYVVPCSIPVGNATAYFTPAQDDYAVMQLLDGDDGKSLDDGRTEWVQYDTLSNDGHACRLHPALWQQVRAAVTDPAPTLPPGAVGNNTVPAAHDNSGGIGQFGWLGDPEGSKEAGLVYLIRTRLSFRGTDRTWTHSHALPTQIIPAFLVLRGDIFQGRPGRLDRISILEPKQSGPAIWRTVNWASVKPPSSSAAYYQYWVATREQPKFIIEPGQAVADPTKPPPPSIDSRDYARIVKPPSGELPRKIGTVAVGGRFDGLSQSFPGTIDEIEFTGAGNNNPGHSPLHLGRYIVRQECTASDQSITLEPQLWAFPHGLLGDGSNVLGLLPKDAGIMKIGDELIGYESYDPSSGTLTIAPGGRGVLGTTPRAHGIYETATLLEGTRVTQLSGGASATSSALEIEDPDQFPPAGLVLVGSELIHYTRIYEKKLAMPEYEDDVTTGAPYGATAAAPAGASTKKKGTGIFRGRFGTPAVSHNVGDLVIRFPYRFSDHWAVGTDQPELHYFEFDERAESAFYRSLYWKEELPNSGSSIECLARLDARSPWSAEPNKADGLWLFQHPSTDDGKPNVLLRQGERLEMRFGVRYAPAAFTPIDVTFDETKRANGWKAVPRLRAQLSEQVLETRTLMRKERR